MMLFDGGDYLNTKLKKKNKKKRKEKKRKEKKREERKEVFTNKMKIKSKQLINK